MPGAFILINKKWGISYRNKMDSRERMLLALNHKQGDRIPLDIGGMAQSGMHHKVYTAMREYYGLGRKDPELINIITQAARIDEELMDKMGADARVVYGKWASPEINIPRIEGNYNVFENEFAVGFKMPVKGGIYYDISSHPLNKDDFKEAMASYTFPDPLEDWRFDMLVADAKAAREKGKLTVLMGMCPGIYEVGSWLRGFERYLMEMLTEPENIYRLTDVLSEMKSLYWEKALFTVGEYIDVINEADDMASQKSLIFSLSTYRKLIKPYHTRIFTRAKKAAPHIKCMLHSCGAVSELIPDLIEAGVEILNPVQYSADGMDLNLLKKRFGKDIVFWGGGIDTQSVLQNGTVGEIRDEVKKNIELLSAGGGFVFSPVHIIQPGVPPGNIAAMIEAVKEFGRY
jgi:uroporphyrinogen decarboxylase